MVWLMIIVPNSWACHAGSRRYLKASKFSSSSRVLSAALHADVELLQPATLDEAVKFTRAYEQRNNAMAKLSTGTAK
jgi:hypothetical protein